MPAANQRRRSDDAAKFRAAASTSQDNGGVLARRRDIIDCAVICLIPAYAIGLPRDMLNFERPAMPRPYPRARIAATDLPRLASTRRSRAAACRGAALILRRGSASAASFGRRLFTPNTADAAVLPFDDARKLRRADKFKTKYRFLLRRIAFELGYTQHQSRAANVLTKYTNSYANDTHASN